MPALVYFIYNIFTTRLLNKGDDEKLDGPAVSALRRVIAEVKQRWSVIEWVNNNLLS
jgi:hypothetical protein